MKAAIAASSVVFSSAYGPENVPMKPTLSGGGSAALIGPRPPNARQTESVNRAPSHHMEIDRMVSPQETATHRISAR